MRVPRQNPHTDQQIFVDSLREFLGLAPLYKRDCDEDPLRFVKALPSHEDFQADAIHSGD